MSLDPEEYSLVNSLNSRLKKFKIKIPKSQGNKTRNLSSSQQFRSHSQTAKPKSLKDQFGSSGTFVQASNNELNLPPLPPSLKEIGKTSSFIQHRKRAFGTVAKWDPVQQKEVNTKVWRRTAITSLQSLPISTKHQQKRIVKLTKKLNKLNTKAKPEGFSRLKKDSKETVQSSVSPASAQAIIDRREKRNRRRPKSNFDNNPLSSMKSSLTILRGKTLRDSGDINGASQKVRRIENICKIMLTLKDSSQSSQKNKFDQFGFDPTIKKESERKQDSLSSRIIKLRKRRYKLNQEDESSPLNMIQSKFNQIYKSLKQ
ncbi:unnamed protein product [Moneuplotes crassus]|uniref:Uncharacterized protein n=1 Tax=Euplotes crassus TaxID=5936 RepID=A0AAD1U790_EUPCR|nr:unnamed protein product [Moneuplotes crassus]